jgi:hypothetical protein
VRWMELVKESVQWRAFVFAVLELRVLLLELEVHPVNLSFLPVKVKVKLSLCFTKYQALKTLIA